MLVYKITNSLTDMAYIGVTTVGLEARFKLHLREARKPNPKRYLHRAIAKYGPEAFRIEQIAEAASMEQLLAAERQMVVAHGTFAPAGYNMTDGGEVMKEWCEDLKREASAAKRLWASSERGRALLTQASKLSHSKESQERRARSLEQYRASAAGQAQIAKCVAAMHSPEARAKDAAKKLGKRASAETKAKMSQAQRGRKHSPETKAKMAATRRKRWEDQEYLASQSLRMTVAMADPAARERIRQSNLKTWADPERRREHSAIVSKKMTDADCLRALEELKAGLSVKAVANLHAVSPALIYALRSGRLRKHLPR